MKRVLFIFTVIAALAVPVFAGGLEDTKAIADLYTAKKYPEMIAACKKFLVAYPASTNECAHMQHAIARGFNLQGNRDEAKVAFGEVITRYPSTDLAKDSLISVASLLSKEKKYAEAQAICEKFIAENPNPAADSATMRIYLPNARFCLGTILFDQKKYPEARAVFEKLVSSGQERNLINTRTKLSDMYSYKSEFIKAGNVLLAPGTNQAETQALRLKFNTIATKLNRIANAKVGKSISDASQFKEALAIIAAENTGVGFKVAIQSLGLSVAENFDAELERTKKERDAFLSGAMDKVPSHEFLGRLEFYLGIDQTRAFGVAYNK